MDINIAKARLKRKRVKLANLKKYEIWINKQIEILVKWYDNCTEEFFMIQDIIEEYKLMLKVIDKRIAYTSDTIERTEKQLEVMGEKL